MTAITPSRTRWQPDVATIHRRRFVIGKLLAELHALRAISRAAGDTKAQARVWTAKDATIQKLWWEIERNGWLF